MGDSDYSRTAEQATADDTLTAAIDLARAAYFPEDTEARLLVDYVVVFSELFYDQEGQQRTVVGQLVRDNYLPGYRQRGLLLDALDVARGIGANELGR